MLARLLDGGRSRFRRRPARCTRLPTAAHGDSQTDPIGLADYLGIDRTVMPYVIDDLVTAGFVERAPDPRDRRIRTVVATRAGLAEYEKLSTQVPSAEQRFFAALDDADRATFVRVLSQLAHRD